MARNMFFCHVIMYVHGCDMAGVNAFGQRTMHARTKPWAIHITHVVEGTRTHWQRERCSVKMVLPKFKLGIKFKLSGGLVAGVLST